MTTSAPAGAHAGEPTSTPTVDPDSGEPAAAAPQISVVLPVFNEEQCLAEELERIRRGLDASPYRWELIAVDDASTDRSAEILDQYPWVRRITFRVNRGSGSARHAGCEAARGNVIVWTDADMTYPNDRIAELVDQLDTADQVVGARTSEQGTAKFLRVPAKWMIRRLAEWLTQTKIPDLNSGFRAFRRDAALPYMPLLPRGFSCVTTITVAMLSDDREVRFHDIPYAPRSGKSKFHPLRDTYRYLMQVVRMVTFFNPLRVFFPIALALLLVGAAKLAYDVITDPVQIAINTMLIILTGVQVLVLGLLADLVVARTRSRRAGS
jgi:glycosyltransferase involved in cell wall biosynthesis